MPERAKTGDVPNMNIGKKTFKIFQTWTAWQEDRISSSCRVIQWTCKENFKIMVNVQISDFFETDLHRKCWNIVTSQESWTTHCCLFPRLSWRSNITKSFPKDQISQKEGKILQKAFLEIKYITKSFPGHQISQKKLS